jgi:hypothetical protein
MIDYLCVLFVGNGVNVGHDASFDNMKNCKGIWEKAGEDNSTKAYITSDETSR